MDGITCKTYRSVGKIEDQLDVYFRPCNKISHFLRLVIPSIIGQARQLHVWSYFLTHCSENFNHAIRIARSILHVEMHLSSHRRYNATYSKWPSLAPSTNREMGSTTGSPSEARCAIWVK